MTKETQRERIRSYLTRVNPFPVPLGTARKLSPMFLRICLYRSEVSASADRPVRQRPQQARRRARREVRTRRVKITGLVKQAELTV